MSALLFHFSAALAIANAPVPTTSMQIGDEWPTTADLFANKKSHELKVGQLLPRRELLVPGVRRYLRYAINDGHRSALDIWTRRVEMVEVDGREVLRMSMDWDRPSQPDKPGARTTQIADFDPVTLAPLNHFRRAVVDGKEQSILYRYDPGQVVPIAQDSSVDVTPVPMPEPSYNFEYDMELFQTLDWPAQTVIDLFFYDPGRSPPASYRFGVIGEDQWIGPDGTPIDCWIVTSNYNAGEFNKRMWIAKSTQITVHEEVNWRGATYIKTLIGSEYGDRETVSSGD